MPGQGARKWTCVVLALAFVLSVYFYYGSAGRPGEWPQYMSYYDMLADGFRAGHTHIPLAPRAELLRQANPYDPRNVHLWPGDLTLYHRRYYLYWGPLPALLQAIAKALLGIHRSIGDQYLTFAMYSVSAVSGTLLIERMARRFAPGTPPWLVLVASLAFSLANPTLFLVTTGGVYQAAISGGQAFLVAGLVPAFDAASGAGRVGRRLFLAGAFWGMAVACRVSLLPAVTLMAIVTVLFAAPPRPREVMEAAASLGVPLLLSVLGLLAYNEVRFDHFLDFGVGHILTTVPFRVSSEPIVPNLYSYLARPLEVTCEFPFVGVDPRLGRRLYPAWMTFPIGYTISEPLAGILVAVPLSWPGAVAVVRALHFVRRRRDAVVRASGRHRAYVWCVTCFLVFGTVSAGAFLGLYFATMRYLGDITAGLVLLGVLGGLTSCHLARGRPWALAVQATFASLAIVTASLGMLLGYRGYGEHFKNNNAALHRQLTSALSICSRRGS